MSSCDVGALRRTGPRNRLTLVPQKILVHRPIPQEPTSVVSGACRDGTEAVTVLPKEAGEVEASIVPEATLMQSAPTPVEVPEVG